MPYRISLHFLAAIWNFLILFWAVSLRKTNRYFIRIAVFSFFSGFLPLAWGMGLAFHSIWWIRLTWVSAMMPFAFLIVLQTMAGEPTLKNRLAIFFFISCLIISVVGSLPLTVVAGNFDPPVHWVLGKTEPWLRFALGVLIIILLWKIIQLIYQKRFEMGPHKSLSFSVGIIIYALIALGGAVLLPLLKNYSFLEAASFGTIFWTTFFVWHVLGELNKKTIALTELDQMKKDLISNITHEFKSPLSNVEGALSLLLDDLKEGKLKEEKLEDYLHTVRRNTDRLASFIQDLLEVARIERSRLPDGRANIVLNLKNSDLNAIISDVLSLHRPAAYAKGLSLEFSSNGPLPLSLDAEKIKQVIQNLLSNAIKFTERGAVTIATEEKPDHILVEVWDTGPGIDPKYLSLIFDRFFQVPDTNKKNVKGSGLGLAIVKKWVEFHGGKIWTESEGPGRGSRFCFTLPKGT